MRTGVLPMTPETNPQSSEWVGKTSPRSKKLKFQIPLLKTRLIIFFRLSRRSAQRIHTRGEETVNEEFYKGTMDRLLKRIQRARPAAFCCRDFFLLHNSTIILTSQTHTLDLILTPTHMYGFSFNVSTIDFNPLR